ncbi:2-oxo acid dehydrogenase subunit E2 [Halorubrum ezzemoulense]|uniref:2-oxo acid dehydrogenase subunit E2 n=1 Tax=Halorubrum ezzemoulense TaxID=337243 RepID=A0ABT4Z379_HALEZ|nr:2-oxo acid dehydrogenase subunit E2 [Halorubrum ezzemoulense]MDB2245941.1 2-oxo acid dehydrogenase subunit E2 [Halorubrum ezzemoulense]MDB2252728.1 2-oxo acid dehydrogenase subunit E2 [Halorubrum ezzemoulense]MDB2279654.1 2-oxo acid dehydrogenase subunit E2 [Halorubrum ezzemoulense]MDB2286139.1 2-oxo acid dehydrogenase subunit E2 [Halorubrum ezzemoulense]MDB2289924.1 2-oxo acid dehydrogenase subunit E2 [Halorubrum ezzemoulense]
MTVEEFKLPDVGEGVAEGELVSWLVAPGDRVEEDQPVAEVETDKALVEVPSSYDGVVEELFAEEGEMVPVGDVIISFRVDEDGEAAAGDDAEAEPEPEPDSPDESASEPTTEAADAEPDTPAGRTFAPPSARRLARELGVDVAAVDGSGPGGRVTEADVRAHAEGDAGAADAGGPDDGPEPRPAPTPTDTGSDGRKSAVSKRGADDGSADAPATPAGGPDPAGRETTLATPATRKAARDRDVDIDDVPTDQTRDGEAFVTAEAVNAYADALESPASTPEPEPVETDAGTEPAVTAGDASETSAPASGDETVPYRGVRRTIGKQMERSKFTAPHVTHHDTAEVDALVEAREELKPKAEAEGVKLTYMPFVMKAIVAGLKEYPYLNSELREDDEEIVLKSEYNLGIAVATDAGLMVPVVENVDEKGLFELADAVNDLASRARERKLKPAEMQGGTFSITNFGAIGGEYATPIINYPETAILGLGAIEERPVVRDHADVASEFLDDSDDSTVVPAPTLPLSLSIDHRVVDGAVAAEFANTVMEHLENPLLLLNE